MNLELLEPLLRDRALGELSPAVAALLDAHLASDPAAARRAAELADTIRVARTAAAIPLEPPRRPLDLARLHGQSAIPRTTGRRTEVLALAACLALGLAGGWLFRASRTVATPPTVIAVVTPRATEPSGHFWSVSHFAPAAAAKSSTEKKL